MSDATATDRSEDWAEPEDFGAWGSFDPLIDSPDDLQEVAAAATETPQPPSKEEKEKKATETLPPPSKEEEEEKKAAVAMPMPPPKEETEKKADVAPPSKEETEKKAAAAVVTALPPPKDDAVEVRSSVRAKLDSMKAHFSSDALDMRSFVGGGSLLRSLQETDASTPLDALSRVAGRAIASVSDMGSPIVQQYASAATMK
ncbi:MAG: hypothetical protein WC483_03395 [Candidatus Paceibacterota bacterium]